MILNQKSVDIGDNFGGKQTWLYETGKLNKFWADRSCGVVAAANTIKYLSENHPDKRDLYFGEGKDDYIELMEELYKYLQPRVWGIPTISKMGKALERFSAGKGISIKSNYCSWVIDSDEGSRFIRQGLFSNSPVLLLTWNHSDKQFRNHWVTVTGWDVIYGEEYMTVSNWGEKKTYSYRDWVMGKSLYKGAIYFE